MFNGGFPLFSPSILGYCTPIFRNSHLEIFSAETPSSVVDSRLEIPKYLRGCCLLWRINSWTIFSYYMTSKWETSWGLSTCAGFPGFVHVTGNTSISTPCFFGKACDFQGGSRFRNRNPTDVGHTYFPPLLRLKRKFTLKSWYIGLCMFRVFFCVFYMVQLYSLQIPRLQILVCWKVASGMVAELRAEGAGGWSKIRREVVKPDLGSQATVTWYKALNLIWISMRLSFLTSSWRESSMPVQ